ncbi:MAG: transcriptional regulator [Acidocella sp. 20-57-95]|nr:MAG: transcriptional regulator [Acidocella sp. 20-57-95]OYV60990.1 MAG: transcriptional regulator [Acidocella sp. 21-58-7]HQT64152.1 helix-turn-helix domain-containing protein [Acidocella sp.]HQU03589.1 helix-turn-helix domain-containing protein [Acidocella sp.]
MTPFGEKLRALRAARGVLQRDMAAALEVSAAYLSALEHGRRGAPSAGLIHQICDFFGLIWDEADELRILAKLSRPRVRVNAAGLTAAQTALANRLAKCLRDLDVETVQALVKILDEVAPVTRPVRRVPAKTRVRVAAASRGS